MKKLLLLLLLAPSLGLAQLPTIADQTYLQQALSVKIDVVGTIAELKMKAVSGSPASMSNVVTLVQGSSSPTDGQGALYKWVAGATDAEDMAFLNVVTSSLSPTGRWIRLNVRNQQLPGGKLSTNGGVKVYRGSGVTNSNGELTANLTMDGTPTGVPIFSTLFFKQTNAVNAITTANDYIWGGYKSATSDLRQITFKYIRASVPLTAIVGLLINPVVNAPANTPVEFWIEGQ